MDNVTRFKQIVSEMVDTYERKNSDYNNSFETTLDKWGVNIGLARIDDKFNRITALLSSVDQKVNDESIEDTLKDMATYTIMLLMWLKKGTEYTNSSTTFKTNNSVPTYETYNYDYLKNIKHWKLKGGIDSKGFPIKTLYADVEKYEVVGDNIKIYFNNVKNPKGTIVGSGNFVSLYPIDKLSEYDLDKI